MKNQRYGIRLRKGYRFSRKNISRLWLKVNNKSLKEYTGMCLDLAYDVGKWLEKKKISYSHVTIEPIDSNTLRAQYPDAKFIWIYHVVLMLNGFIHDPWLEKPVPVMDYVSRIFPDQKIELEYRKSVNGDIVSVETRCGHNVLYKKCLRG